ncbi:PREDICTED: mitochondrial cardiolipin hydrolase [Polistes canadensis]|uniref:mitochondrial cardiolipin hydrolase n=1 Tax=Polistes canadensis TaxID=91411 RepID=UPI000718DCCA|nr:PREDICTED: mitochondrial cardiolipin hydrolase [Polistes canadensis]
MLFISTIKSVIMNTTSNAVSKLSRDKYEIYFNMTLVKRSLSIANVVIFSILANVIFTSKFIWERYKKYSKLDKSINLKEKFLELNPSLNNEYIMEILFFTEDSVSCRMHLGANECCEKLDCSVANLNKLTNYLHCAKDTIHVCMYLFTCQILGNAILNAHKRGVVVKVIVDAGMNTVDHSQILPFRRACIKVRTRTSDSLMHHKFVIIDNKILITGSANWTMQALFGNSENIIVTNHPVLVERFVNEFTNLWKIYDNDLIVTVTNLPNL